MEMDWKTLCGHPVDVGLFCCRTNLVTCDFVLYPEGAAKNTGMGINSLATTILDNGGWIVNKQGPHSIAIVDFNFMKENGIGGPTAKEAQHDLFTANFIYDSVANQRVADLNLYRFSKSKYEKYDANDVLFKRLAWSDLDLTVKISAGNALRHQQEDHPFRPLASAQRPLQLQRDTSPTEVSHQREASPFPVSSPIRETSQQRTISTLPPVATVASSHRRVPLAHSHQPGHRVRETIIDDSTSGDGQDDESSCAGDSLAIPAFQNICYPTTSMGLPMPTTPKRPALLSRADAKTRAKKLKMGPIIYTVPRVPPKTPTVNPNLEHQGSTSMPPPPAPSVTASIRPKVNKIIKVPTIVTSSYSVKDIFLPLSKARPTDSNSTSRKPPLLVENGSNKVASWLNFSTSASVHSSPQSSASVHSSPQSSASVHSSPQSSVRQVLPDSEAIPILVVDLAEEDDMDLESVSRAGSPAPPGANNANGLFNNKHRDYVPYRTLFSKAEGQILLDVIMEENWYFNYSANKIYEWIADKKILRRTPQSMNNHFRKIVLPNLEKHYKLTVLQKKKFEEAAKFLKTGKKTTAAPPSWLKRKANPSPVHPEPDAAV